MVNNNMKLNYKFISLLIILFFVSLSLVSAASDDNQTLQLNDDNGIQKIDNSADELSAGTGTFTELQQLIWSSKNGDTITLDKDYSYDSSFTRTNIQVPRSSLTIDGQGHTLDAKNAIRIFYVTDTASNLVVKNLNFINGKQDTAGAIFSVGSNTKIIGCGFENNVATTGNVGGAVLLKNGGSITDSTFKSNSAPSSGGAIRLEGDGYSVTGCTFENNKAGSSLGGAINALGDKITISGNTFTSNTAGRDGGAIDIEGKGTAGSPGYNNVVTNNKFSGNTAIYGGAVSANGGSLTISGNEFSKNHATELGGAIRIVGVDGTTGTISKNTFNGDYADKSGGAIFSNGNGLTVDDNKFTGTKSTSSDGAGGAITIHGSKNTITNNDIKSTNAKGSGGAIFFEGDNGKVNNNNFTGAHSSATAGALYITGASATVNGNKFESNTADNLGGALQFKSDNGNINNNIFTANTAKASGGAAYIEGSGITATANTFTNNKGESNSVGGAIRWNGNKATLTENTFEGNSATNTGYAVYGDGDNSQITKNTFIGSQEGDKSLDWRGNNNQISGNIYGNSRETTLTMEDITVYYGGSGKLVITLNDKTSKPLAKKDIVLTFNGADTTLSTDGNGKAEYEIKDLALGTYKATAKFAGDKDYDASTATATVSLKSTITSSDLTAEYGDAKYNATFVDSNGKALAKGEYVSFTVDNTPYRTQVGDNGVATVTLNEAPGDYNVNIVNTKTGESATNKIKINKASANLQATAKDIAEGENAVIDISSKVQNAEVTLTINNKNYPATLEKGKAKVTISNLTAGKYPYTVKFAGNDNYTAQSISGTLNVKSDSVIITAENVSKFYGGSERLRVKLTDKTGAALANKNVTITLNNVPYERKTNENGETSVGINLPSGNYTAKIEFKGDADYKAVDTICNVEIKSTITGEDVVKIEKANKPYTVKCLDTTGKLAPKDTEVEFNINGVYYTRKVKDDGTASLNLNLGEGKYTITAINKLTGENAANTVTIKSRFVNNSDVTKFYRNGTQYYITVLDDNGNPAKAGENVTFNINGVFYTRQTNENGTAKMNINLQPDTYIITAEYKGCKASNTIKVLPVLSAKDITMKYRDGTKFVANLINGEGKPLANETIIFNINGVFYNRITGEDGAARLNINLMAGEYIITSSYNGANIANKVTINA